MKRPQKFCGMCGLEREPLTRDHVIPKSWYRPAKPTNLYIWKLCAACNGRLSPAEERLRNVYASAYGMEDDQNQELLEKARRSACRFQTFHGVLERPSGLVVPAVFTKLPPADVELVYTKIARGLTFKLDGVLLDRTLPITVAALSGNEAREQIMSHIREFGCKATYFGEAFSWMRHVGDRIQDSSWLFLPLGVGLTLVRTGRFASASSQAPVPMDVRVRDPWKRNR